tara:strand:- start:106 stop:546 length:441 start_codon:yes stop_codon:yes gene_type:complete
MNYGPGSWPAHLQEIIDEFTEIDEAMEKIELLFDFASEIDELPVEEWSEATRVHGCQSEAHIKAMQNSDGTFHLKGAADAKLVQGLIAITAIALEGLEPEIVTNFPPDYAKEMGLMHSLTPSRANGFRNMFQKVIDSAEEMVSKDE